MSGNEMGLDHLRLVVASSDSEARSELRNALHAEDGVEVVQEFDDVNDLLVYRGRLENLVVVVDVGAMRDGFELFAKALRNAFENAALVAVSKDLSHAAYAYDADAQDFLHLPLANDRVFRSMRRVRRFLRSNTVEPIARNGTAGTRAPECFFIKNGEAYTIVRAKDILWAESAGNYMVLHTDRGNQLLRRTVTALAEELEPLNFIRVNRSAVVNLDCIEEIEQGASSDFDIRLRNDVKIPYTGNLKDLKRSLRAAV